MTTRLGQRDCLVLVILGVVTNVNKLIARMRPPPKAAYGQLPMPMAAGNMATAESSTRNGACCDCGDEATRSLGLVTVHAEMRLHAARRAPQAGGALPRVMQWVSTARQELVTVRGRGVGTALRSEGPRRGRERARALARRSNGRYFEPLRCH